MLVMGVEQFDAMTVRIAEIDKQRAADAVASWASFQLWRIASPATSQARIMSLVSGMV